jgi:hypothetical protein
MTLTKYFVEKSTQLHLHPTWIEFMPVRSERLNITEMKILVHYFSFLHLPSVFSLLLTTYYFLKKRKVALLQTVKDRKVEALFQTFLTSSLHRGEWSDPSCLCFPSMKVSTWRAECEGRLALELVWTPWRWEKSFRPSRDRATFFYHPAHSLSVNRLLHRGSQTVFPGRPKVLSSLYADINNLFIYHYFYSPT